MEPTLIRNDRFVARMGELGPFRRGEIVLVTAPQGAVYVKRIAGLPGDRIAVAGGVVMINGGAVPQRLVRVEESRSLGFPGPARRLAERFPGEGGDHEIYDFAPSEFDDFAETLVRPGYLFLLGDNRDHSADSRVPRALAGLEQVPVSDVVGRPLFFSWWPGQRMRGRPISE
jgi:signal peptidase I